MMPNARQSDSVSARDHALDLGHVERLVNRGHISPEHGEQLRNKITSSLKKASKRVPNSPRINPQVAGSGGPAFNANAPSVNPKSASFGSLADLTTFRTFRPLALVWPTDASFLVEAPYASRMSAATRGVSPGLDVGNPPHVPPSEAE
jgi:hypothetical protein